MSILWTINHPTLTGTELFELRETARGVTLWGRVVARVEGVPCAIEYRMAADHTWVTRRADIRLETGHEGRNLTIDHDGRGSWSVDGLPRAELAGCTDIDLGVSPSTNLLPIRRLGLEVGGMGSLVAAWVRFPDLVVEPLPQSYERTAEGTYTYRSDSFQADLEVDERGIVHRYGEDLWRALHCD